MMCPRCSTDQPQEAFRNGVCEGCSKLERSRAYHIQKNSNWVELAEEAGLSLYERQPGETDAEYAAWSIYRDMYPNEKPSLKVVAERCGLAYKSVKNISSKWGFATRLQAWIKDVDYDLINKRRNDLLTMNETHMYMAMQLNAKIAEAITMIRPATLEPKDINALMKTASELERKARTDQMALVAQGNPNNGSDENPDLRKTNIKSDDIGEIIKILGTAGVIGDFGIRQTTTTEVVVKGEGTDEEV